MRPFYSMIALLLVAVPAASQESEATQILKARSAELQPVIVQVSDSVYCAVGYSPANISMIVGDEGIVIVDTGMFAAHAQAVLAEFRRITDLPVAAVILTHGHGDHTGGTSTFIRAGKSESSVPVYARSPFNTEGTHFKTAGVTINALRGARQGGFLLPPEKRINNGIAPAMYPPKETDPFQGEPLTLDVKFEGDRQRVSVAGIELDLVAAPGETSDQLYVWFPKDKVVFTGDNFYRSWPNLYAIRGTGYRDVRLWIQSLDMMLAENPEHAVPGHTLPLLGREETHAVMEDYRDAIQFVFDATIEGMNAGMTPDELVHSIELPPEFASQDHLGEFYGNIEWGIRAIFDGYLGWFDGNPTNLFSLAPEDEARKMAELAGGVDALHTHAKNALEEGEAQWCARLCDFLIALNPDAKEPKQLKADALERLAEDLLTATGRNYYLTVAQELRAEAQ